MIDFLIENHTIFFKLQYGDYRKLLKSVNCDVYNLLKIYGMELYYETSQDVTMIIADIELFSKFFIEEKYEIFPE